MPNGLRSASIIKRIRRYLVYMRRGRKRGITPLNFDGDVGTVLHCLRDVRAVDEKFVLCFLG